MVARDLNLVGTKEQVEYAKRVHVEYKAQSKISVVERIMRGEDFDPPPSLKELGILPVSFFGQSNIQHAHATDLIAGTFDLAAHLRSSTTRRAWLDSRARRDDDKHPSTSRYPFSASNIILSCHRHGKLEQAWCAFTLLLSTRCDVADP